MLFLVDVLDRLRTLLLVMPVLVLVLMLASDLLVHLSTDLLDLVHPEEESRPARSKPQPHRCSEAAVRVQLGEILQSKVGGMAVVLQKSRVKQRARTVSLSFAAERDEIKDWW